MPLRDQRTGESVAEQMTAEQSEKKLREETEKNLLMLNLTETRKALTVLLNSTESFTQNYLAEQKQTNAKLDELLKMTCEQNDRQKGSSQTELQEAATEYAAAAANKFDDYCERILAQRVGGSVKKLDEILGKLEKRVAGDTRSRWIDRAIFVFSGLSCLFLLILLLLQIF